MSLFFYSLPKALFFPTYLLGILGFIILLTESFCCLHKTKRKSVKSYLFILFTILLLGISTISFRSTRYVFLLAFPFTFFATCFITSFSNLFTRHTFLVLLTIIFVVITRNTIKVLRTDPYARFFFEASEKIEHYANDSENILLIGDSKDIGRVSFQTGYPYCEYPYPVEDETDLKILKEHYCDKFDSLIFICSDRDNHYSFLPQEFFSVEKSKQNKKLSFTKIDLQPSNSNSDRTTAKNLFVNPLLNLHMDPNAVQRIKNYFHDNPKVLEIVCQDGFFWPYAWPFDNTGRYFPKNGFDFYIDKASDGNQAIHLKSNSSLPFFHAIPFSMDNAYQMSLRLDFVEDSEVSILLRYSINNKTSFEEIKVIREKAGENRIYNIPIYPGKLQRVSQQDRANGKVFFSFSLMHGNVRFSDFYLQAI